MATFDTTRPFASGNPVSGRMTQALSLAHGKVLDWFERRQTLRMLDSLTDRELNDIGLSRYDIAHKL